MKPVSELTVAQFVDERGVLKPIEFSDLPFFPQRIFTVQGVPVGTVRGRHGHRTCWQFLVALTGAIEVTIYSGSNLQTILLESGGPGLIIPPGVIAEQCYIKTDSTLLVLASDAYDPDDYLYKDDLLIDMGAPS